jgi:hypothetical protein
MAQENLDMPSFSIEETMDMGAGNAQLLNDLFTPEDINPEDVKEIKEEKKAPVELPKSEEEKEEPKEEKQNLLASFLDDEEEEIKEEKPKAKETEEPLKEEEVQEDSQFAALSRDLFKLGVFTETEDEEPITTPEQFLEKFNSEKVRGANEMVNNFIGQFGEDYKQAFDAIFVKGVDPKEYFGTYNNVVSFADMDLTREDNQESVVRQSLLNQDWAPEEVSEEIERLKNIGDLEIVAKRHHKGLVKKEAQKLQELEQKAEQELQQKQYMKQQYVQNIQTILQEKVKAKEFDGIPLNPQLASELQNFLLEDKWKTPQGELLSDFDKAILDLKKPENHAQKVKVALLIKLLEKDPTLSTIQKAGISKKSDKLFESVQKVTKKEVKNEQPKSWFS